MAGPAPRKFSSEETLYAAALRALARRAHSGFEMRALLERRATAQALARQVIARLKREKLIDDARYALEFARSRANLRRRGPFRIARELRARGVYGPDIEAAIAQVFSETDETALVRKVIEQRMRAARGPLDEKKMASLYRTLLRAGFATDLIRRELHTLAKVPVAVPDPWATEEEE